MARQNIDEEWKTDPRRKLLVKKLGSERLADGMRVEINWLILDHKGRPIPLKKFKFVEDYEAWIDCGLAEIKGEMVEIAGANRYGEWFEKQKENGLKGGRPKKNPEEPNETQNNPNEPNEEKDNPKNPSYSFSSSKELRKNTYSQKFEEIWDRYPNRGLQKSNAFKRFEKQITSEAKHNDLSLSVANYNRLLKIETWRSPKQFDSFLGTERSGYFWEQFINPDPKMFVTAEPAQQPVSTTCRIVKE